MRDAKEQADYDVPEHLRNAPTKLMKEMGLGAGTATPTTNPTPTPPARTISARNGPYALLSTDLARAGRENRRKVGMAG